MFEQYDCTGDIATSGVSAKRAQTSAKGAPASKRARDSSPEKNGADIEMGLFFTTRRL